MDDDDFAMCACCYPKRRGEDALYHFETGLRGSKLCPCCKKDVSVKVDDACLNVSFDDHSVGLPDRFVGEGFDIQRAVLASRI